jgi:hypothetical protein
MDRKDPAMKTAKTVDAVAAAVPAIGKAKKKAPAPAKVIHLDAPEKSKKAPAKKDAKGKPRNAMTAKYAPALKAIVASLIDSARSAASAGLEVASRLAEAMAMEPHKATGHETATAWAYALLVEACPMAGTSTVYAWIEAGTARSACVGAGIDPALFPMDTLRVIGSKSVTGQDPKRMAALASELAADDSLRNGAGKVDPVKARKYVKGEAADSMDRGEKVQRLVRTARKFGGNGDAAIALLQDAIEAIRNA